MFIKIAGLYGMFLTVGLCSVIAHETGHAIAAIFKGVPPNELVVGWYGIGPGVTVPDSFPTVYLTFFRYSGGVIAGLALILTYAFLLIFQRSSKPVRWGNTRWWIGEFFLFWGVFQLLNGYIEAALFEQYVRTGGSQLTFAFLIAFPVSLVVHAGVTIISRRWAKPT